MGHWKKGFPSRFLQTSDLDVPIVATIKSVGSESIGSAENAERKLVVRFVEPAVKAVVLNLTRAEAIESVAGDPDTDKWTGVVVRLVKGSTRYQGRRVDCIDIEAPDDIDSTMRTATEVL